MTNEHLRISKGNNDECYTPRYGVEPILEFLLYYSNTQKQKPVIWCPFDDENSEFVKVFKENGFQVVYSHIKNGQDFYCYEPELWDVMISNPPFTNKAQIFRRALSFNKPFALLMTITWLNDPTPANVFGDKELQILSFNERMKFKNQAQEGKISFLSAYFCWNFLPKNFIFRSLKNRNQLKLEL